MLLNAVIICCMIVVNAESSLNSYSFTGDSNGYDYSNSVTNNGYLESQDGYQNVGNFYDVGDTNRKLSNHISSHSLINAGNQGNIGGDMGNSYNGYSANDHGSEYAGYSKTYDNSDRDAYVLSTRVTPTSFRGYSGHNSNRESAFNAYSSDSVQDSDFSQYSNYNKRMPAYSGYSKPTVLEHYSEDSADSSNVQGYHDSSDSPGYSDSDQIYSSYSPGGPSNSEYSFGKQKGGPYNFKGRNKYGDIYSTASETRYTRGNAAHVGHNRDVLSYSSDSRPNVSQYFKMRGVSSASTAGKPSKYSYKSRYAPNSSPSYLARERDSYYAAYAGKGNGKIVIIKDSRPSYGGQAYSEPSYADNGGYRSKSGGFTGYSTSNFDRHGGGNSHYDDGPAMPRRYRYASGPMLVQKTVYS